MPKVAHVHARVAGPAGQNRIVKGRVYDDHDPLVRAHPWAFDSPDEAAQRAQKPMSTADLGDRSMSARFVEQATAAPGEVRNVGHPCVDCDRTFKTALALASHRRVHA